MIHYNVWFRFKGNVEETAGLAVIHAFLGEMLLARIIFRIVSLKR
jgi:hypothetical protein